MRRILVAATAIGVTLAGAAVAANAWAEEDRPAPGYAPPIAWGKCADQALASRKAECGFLAVPRDHDRPDGPKLKLAVSRIKHTAADYQGVMLVNPGGPGGSGLTLSALGDYVPDGAGKSYDWIGFDPRGVGSSKPALSCDPTYNGYNRPPYVPSTAAVEKDWLARTAEYAADCATSGGKLLDHLSTVDTVKDMDLLRRALGEKQINFYGFSYGTYLGQVYATMFPQQVRRMVMDGNVNPARVWYDANLDQDLAFDKSMKVFFAWVAQHHDVYQLGTTAKAVEKRYYDLQAKVASAPAAKVVGPAELTDVFLQAGYYVFGWATVAQAFSAYANKNDAAPLKRLFDEGNPQVEDADNGYAIYLAVQCTDAAWPKSWSRWKTDNWKVHQQAPFETWGNAWFNAPCRTWGAKAGQPVEVTGAKAPPVLLISETLDAATPFSGSLEVRKRFPRAALIEGVGGTTHAGSLFGNKCVDGAVAAYLKNGALPKRVKANTSDLRCKPIAPPAAAAAAEKRAAQPLSRTDLQRRIGVR
ncbi:alpha/beta hydrolase [Actinoplanes sp. NPDC051470]|uniref:alpha/beta hydrolase n=1 Tax=Actinoplanes sp. NPDC051470 TaxID=3157224 RepID=UPI0034204E42